MVRINSTVHLVSSYDISWFIKRNRKQGTATISHFFRPEDPNSVLVVTGAVIHAYNDAKARFELDGKPWSDPLRRNPSAPDDTGLRCEWAGSGDVNESISFLEYEDHPNNPRKRRRGGEDGGPMNKKVKHFAMNHTTVFAAFYDELLMKLKYCWKLSALHIAFRCATLFSTGFSCFYQSIDGGTQARASSARPVPSTSFVTEEGSLSEIFER
jgi:hypothetical protein